ncbi:hypothetical protein TRAPUB_1015 [Trametes pubescens]|uniref:Uncharacterized protein n=1 Tax=Trametes pubescens TaxID=154538 RepID=A0A1M2VKI4_TRAPU|nr:hypothetical protein TRAPUB_1015 [Trametes pubescens]
MHGDDAPASPTRITTHDDRLSSAPLLIDIALDPFCSHACLNLDLHHPRTGSDHPHAIPSIWSVLLLFSCPASD